MKTLTWTINKTVSASCPDYVPDPYTGEYPSYHCAVYHCQIVIEEMSKQFETEEEATQFMMGAPKSCQNFYFDGKKLEDSRPDTEEMFSSLTNGTGSITFGNSGNSN